MEVLFLIEKGAYEVLFIALPSPKKVDDGLNRNSLHIKSNDVYIPINE